MATVVYLSMLREARLEVYIILFTVCYFTSSVLFRPRRRWFDIMGAALFLAFCYIVTSKALYLI